MFGKKPHQLKSPHPDDATRAARLAWNVLRDISRESSDLEMAVPLARLALHEMNKNGIFEKPGVVTQGSIQGDIGGREMSSKSFLSALGFHEPDHNYEFKF